MTFKMHVRGVQVKSQLRVTVLKRLSQFEELMRQLKLTYMELDEKLVKFNDHQNEHIIQKQHGRRYTVRTWLLH